ncbi:MAG: roadblock/LC7 domain-containing protein [Thermoplasmata archaeon]
MPNIPMVESVLNDIKAREHVKDALVVSRSGMHIAGSPPPGAHLETFVAMSAILLGAAETATSELKESLNYLSVNLRDTRVLIFSAGPKALLVVRVNADATESLLPVLTEYAKKLQGML